MTTPSSKYRFTIGIKLEEEGKNEPPMMESSLVYNGLSYAHVVGLESALPGMIEKLNDLGKQKPSGDFGGKR